MTAKPYSDTGVEKSGQLQTLEVNCFGDSGYGRITSNADLKAQFTNFLNEAKSRYIKIASKYDGTLQVDDANHTTDPLPAIDLVDGQQSYGLDTAFSKILSVEVKDANGKWQALTEIDELEFNKRGESLSAYYEGVEGTPQEFNMIGPSLFLYPTPSYNSTGGLKIRVQRPPSHYLTTDTTKVTGFMEEHDPYFTDFATYKYSLNHTIASKADYRELVRVWEEESIPEDYADRNKGSTPEMTMEPINSL